MLHSPLLQNSQFINRDWTGGRASLRLDRDNWNFNGQNNFIDCHFLRPGCNHISELWRILLPETYCYPGNIKFFSEYVKAFMS